MSRTVEHGSKSQQIELRRAELEAPFWPAAIEILQEHDSDVLRRRVLQTAEALPHVEVAGTEEIVRIIESNYDGDTRKYVNEREVNHAYQVALLTAHAIGWRSIQHDTFATALAHDLDENTPKTPAQITGMTSSRIYRGIDALSHKTGGRKIYPFATDKRPYFTDLLLADEADPELGILTIKAVDQLAVANGPLTASELKDPALEKKWSDMTQRKIEEMQLLQSMLSLPQRSRAGKRIGDNIAFTQMRSEPTAAIVLDATLQAKRSRKMGV